MAIVAINRDPFARATLYRESVRNTEAPQSYCTWCGQAPRTLYRYAWIFDSMSGDSTPRGRLFCSVSCWRSWCY